MYIYVTSVQFYNTSSRYWMGCLPPKVESSSITMYFTPFTLYCLLPFPLVTIILLSVSMSFCLFVHLVCSFAAFSFTSHI